MYWTYRKENPDFHILHNVFLIIDLLIYNIKYSLQSSPNKAVACEYLASIETKPQEIKPRKS
jgi:hypothetical protein